MNVRIGTMTFVVCALVLTGIFTAGATARASTEESVCSAPVPILLDAVPGDRQITISWIDAHTGNADLTGYNVYYDRDGESQPITTVPPQTRYTNTGLTNGQEYCYKVTSLYTHCESGFSNKACATPAGEVPQK